MLFSDAAVVFWLYRTDHLVVVGFQGKLKAKTLSEAVYSVSMVAAGYWEHFFALLGVLSWTETLDNECLRRPTEVLGDVFM